MGWDSSRPVPWDRMIREWLIYVAIMLVILLLFFRSTSLIGVIAGLLVSGPMYLGFGYLLAKCGYQRKSLAELRTERGERRDERSSARSRAAADDEVAGPRPKPAPTRRTGGGTSRPGGARRKR